MSADELHELAEDIKLHHQRIPVSIQEGKLLDGRNRLDAMERAGMPVANKGTFLSMMIAPILEFKSLCVTQGIARIHARAALGHKLAYE